MPSYKLIDFRNFRGVDRTSNARVTNPGSFFLAENFWMPNPGELEQIPGSTTFTYEVELGEMSPDNTGDNAPGSWFPNPDGFRYAPTLAQYDNTVEHTIGDLDPDRLSGSVVFEVGRIAQVAGAPKFDPDNAKIGTTIYKASF